jgi:beta-1,2-mannobiose phosphorylase / 1,2-beta-oligomannan phosphorylase
MSMMMFTDTSRESAIAKDPAVVELCDKFFLYYTIKSQSKGLGIGIAESLDLDNWKKTGEVPPLSPCDSKGVAAPGAIVLDGVVHLFYQSYEKGFQKAAICHATSSDGVNFTPNASNPIFSPTGDWNCGRAIDADVIEHEGQLLLYFSTRDPDFENQMTGVAAAPLSSGFCRNDWKQLCHNTILGPELPWEQNCIEAAAVCRHEGKLYMFYGGAYNCGPQQIGCAVSKDGINWKRVSDMPIVPNGAPGEWNSSESGHPFVLEDAHGIYHLFFQGSPDDGKSYHLSRRRIIWQDGIPKIESEQGHAADV